MISKDYINTLKHIKEQILSSRYRVAKIANKEMLFLYFEVGKIISNRINTEKWGSKTIEKLSNDLQKELNGLRGFSSTNLKRMKQFYTEWSVYIKTTPFSKFSPLVTDQIKTNETSKQIQNSPLSTDKFIEHFTSLSFTAHYELITKTKYQ